MRRKVVSSTRTLLQWENMFNATLECGHTVAVQMLKGKCPRTAKCWICTKAKE